MKARQIVGLLAIALAVIIVGMCDKQAQEAEHNQYCNNVREGVWPDYRETFKAECGGKDPPKFREDLTK